MNTKASEKEYTGIYAYVFNAGYHIGVQGGDNEATVAQQYKKWLHDNEIDRREIQIEEGFKNYYFSFFQYGYAEGVLDYIKSTLDEN